MAAGSNKRQGREYNIGNRRNAGRDSDKYYQIITLVTDKERS